MAGKRPRISLNPEQPGLNTAFGGLQIGGLPAGPEEPSPAQISRPVVAGRVVLRRETAGRGGKTVIVIDDFGAQHNATALEELARKLRTACGGGGTVKERTIELQGDQAAKIRALLQAEGFQVAGVK